MLLPCLQLTSPSSSHLQPSRSLQQVPLRSPPHRSSSRSPPTAYQQSSDRRTYIFRNQHQSSNIQVKATRAVNSTLSLPITNQRPPKLKQGKTHHFPLRFPSTSPNGKKYLPLPSTARSAVAQYRVVLAPSATETTPGMMPKPKAPRRTDPKRE